MVVPMERTRMVLGCMEILLSHSGPPTRPSGSAAVEVALRKHWTDADLRRRDHEKGRFMAKAEGQFSEELDILAAEQEKVEESLAMIQEGRRTLESSTCGEDVKTVLPDSPTGPIDLVLEMANWGNQMSAMRRTLQGRRARRTRWRRMPRSPSSLRKPGAWMRRMAT